MDDKLVKDAKRGNRTAIDKLFTKNKDLMDYKANSFRKAALPLSAIKAEAYKIFLVALNRYNVGSGIKFRTFLESHLRLNRFVTTYGSVVRIPENRALEVQRYRTTKSGLESMYNREITPIEMADHLGWRLQQVEKMEKTLGRQLYSESESMERKFSLETHSNDRYKETLELMYYSLPPEEQLILDYSRGNHGKSKLKIVEIAKRLKMSTDKIYRILKKIDRRLHQGT